MKKVLGISLILVSVLSLSSCVTQKGDSMERMGDDEAMMKMEGGAMIKQDSAMEQEDSAMIKMTGSYTTYSQSAVAQALADGKKVVLFFHAPWCPTCKAADDIFSKETPPDGIALFKVDYDSSTELRKKYSVTYQHTFVALNADETLKKKSSGEKSYAALEELF